jgi:HD-like signal output (HDOD) protein
MDQHRPRALERAIALAKESGVTVAQAEDALFGFTDAEVGGALALHWNFPSELADAVAQHQRRLEEIQDQESLAAYVVRARDYARSHGLTDGVDLPTRMSPSREWVMAPLAPILEQGGGIDGIMQRASVFIDQTMGAG